MKEQFNILLFEKDENVGSMLQEFMQMGNIPSATFTEHELAYQAFCDYNFTICLISLDVNPEKEFELAKKLKSIKNEVVVIFIGAHPTIETITEAYSIGADDFIRKPFILEELYLRTLAILKRTHNIRFSDKQIYRVGKYTFDTHKQILSIGEKNTKVTTKECDLLKYLCDNINLIVEREGILKSVWKNDTFHNARSMDVYITKLRRLLKDDNMISIVNIHGKGYKLMVHQQAI